MSSATVEAEAWFPRRWWLLTGLIFVVQVSLIFWLGEHTRERPRPLGRAPRLRLTAYSPRLALEDPTLFALPHQRGFSGPAWLEVKPFDFPSYDWSEPPRWLSLSLAPLSATFEQEARETNAFDPLQLLRAAPPQLTIPSPAVLPPVPGRSVSRLEGELAGRGLLSTPQLPSWRRPEILTNSVVQLVVDAQGWPLSTALISSSGWKEADDVALARTRGLRLKPLGGEGPSPRQSAAEQLMWGELVFEWQTLAPTNAPP